MAQRPPQRRKPQARTTSKQAPRPRTGGGAQPRPATARRPQSRPKARRSGGFGRFVRGTLLVLVLLAIAIGVTGCAVYASMSSQLPDPDLTKAKGRDQSTVILDRNGDLLARLYAEENRQDVRLAKMPAHLKQAVIATEDRRFYEHTGVDPIGIGRAVVTDILLRRKAQGGSTITQQYVKQAFVTSEKTLKRKIQEAILAQKVEKQFTKDEILGLYLNTIYFGHGAYGVEAASRAYFGKGVAALDLPQAAMIAGVIKSPGLYSPYLHPEAAKKRRDTVLSQMLAQGYITQADYRKAVDTPIKTSGLKARATKAPYFVEWIKQQLISEYGENAVYR
ncbi:MAG: penicillin-binding protein, partial [Actinobacteria bacterium]